MHVLGAGSNPLLSAHCVETAGRLALTLTYAPLFHSPDTVAAVGAGFLTNLAELAAAGPLAGSVAPSAP